MFSIFFFLLILSSLSFSSSNLLELNFPIGECLTLQEAEAEAEAEGSVVFFQAPSPANHFIKMIYQSQNCSGHPLEALYYSELNQKQVNEIEKNKNNFKDINPSPISRKLVSSWSPLVKTHAHEAAAAHSTFTLKNPSDDGEGNFSACVPSEISSGNNCTLRSALGYCMSASLNCHIYLPLLSTIYLTEGDIVNTPGNSFSISIYGQGSTITTSSSSPSSPSSSSSRFLTYEATHGENISLSLFDLELTGFGSSSEDGGVLYLDGVSSVLISSVIFSSNHGRFGGAIHALNSNHVEINNSSLRLNIAEDGGALYANWNHGWKINGCSFENNIAINNGGAIYLVSENVGWIITNSEFRRNLAQFGSGGAVYAEQENSGWAIKENLFLDNSAYDSGGVFHLFKNNPTWSFIESIFQNNTAGSNGGVLILELTGNDAWDIDSSLFIANMAPNGGVFYANGGNSYWTITNSIFLANSASIYGGAFYINTYSHYWQINDCLFEFNYANYAGVLFLSSYNIGWTIENSRFHKNTARAAGVLSFLTNHIDWTFRNCEFENNYAYTVGGGIMGVDENDNCTILDSRFKNNTAGRGGGLYLESSNHGWTIANTVFEDNKAKIDGGGIYFSTLNENVRISNCSFLRNSASISGGAIAVFTLNLYFSIENSRFLMNQAIYGGGVYFGNYNQHLHHSDLDFTSNMGSMGGGLIFSKLNIDISIERSFFSSNVAEMYGGGVLYEHRNVGISMIECWFTGNSAWMGGGLLFDNSNLMILILSSSWRNNRASNGGGMSLLVSNDGLLCQYCQFVRNDADENGGGVSILISNEAISFVNSSFLSNQVKMYGGGLYMSQSNSRVLISSNFSLNSGFSGGAIYISDSNSAILVMDSTFDTNIARMDGGGLYLSLLNVGVSLVRVSFMFNQAMEGNGGGILILSPITLFNSLFSSNSGSSGGGMSFVGISNLVFGGLIVENNTAMDLGGGMFLSDVSNITFSKSVIMNNKGSEGGGLYLAEGLNVVIWNVSFTSNNASRTGTGGGGGLRVLDSIGIMIEGSSFIMNEAHLGGAINFENVKRISVSSSIVIGNVAATNGGGFNLLDCVYVELTSSLFDGNKAFISGGGIWLFSDQILTQRNHFINNVASRSGGGVYWRALTSLQSEPEGLETMNTFVSNFATTGGDLSSSPHRLMYMLPSAISMNSNTAVLVFNHSHQYLDPISLSVVDYYNQTCIDDEVMIIVSTNATLNRCDPDFESLRGGMSIRTNNGVGKFESLDATCQPKGEMLLKFSVGGDESEIILPTSLRVEFLDCEIGEFVEVGRCVVCPVGSYSLSKNFDKECRTECPKGAIHCEGSTIELKSGWWRHSPTSSSTFECPLNSACMGGELTGNESCMVGYTGPACGICETNYYLQTYDNTCQLCPESSVNVYAAIMIVFFACVAVFVLLHQLKLFDLLPDFTVLSCVVHFSKYFWKDFNWENKDFQTLVDRVTCQTKIYFTLFQLLSSLPFVLNIKFPRFYSSLISFGSILNLNFFSDVAISCDFDYDYVDYLIMVTTIPVGLTMILLLTYFINCCYVQLFRQSHSNSFAFISTPYLKIFVLCSFLSLPGISLFIFRTFSCVSLDSEDSDASDDSSYLQVDYRVSCNSDRYYWARSYAIGMVFLYPIGVPMLYLWMLYSHRQLIQGRLEMVLSEAEIHSIEHLKFLYSSYEPKFWYWEVIESFRRVMFTGVLAVFHHGSGLQIVASFLLSVLFIKLYGYYAPFDDDDVDVDGEFAQFQLSAVYFIALLIISDVIPGATDVYDVILCFIILSILLLLFWRLIRESRKKKEAVNRYLLATQGTRAYSGLNLDPSKRVPQQMEMQIPSPQIDYENSVIQYQTSELSSI